MRRAHWRSWPTDLLACVLLTPPGEMGADIVVGSAQRFGVPMGFGGPHAAFMATRDAYRRAMPGRLVGVSVDAAGAPALRLALQTREQHIRREKATSNICTAQVLLAIMAGFLLSTTAPTDFCGSHSASTCWLAFSRAPRLVRAFRCATPSSSTRLPFDVGEPGRCASLARAAAAGFNLRRIDATGIAIALDETVTRQDLDALCAVLGAAAGEPAGGIPRPMLRNSAFLTSEVFHAHRSEHAMLRYLKRLEDRDVALNRSMIPLGSCTMKLNGTAEMMPITWPEFADLHPFAPDDQTVGSREMIARLAEFLAKLTGFAEVSLQPNAGSQGEYAGLLGDPCVSCVRGEAARDVVPDPVERPRHQPGQRRDGGLSALSWWHATPTATSILPDLRTKAIQHAERLAALMVTYPEHARRVRSPDPRNLRGSSTRMAGKSTWTAPT